MELKLKPISRAGINEAIAKVELYRNLNEPGEAESICRDILALDPNHQEALRLLGLAITDQFKGASSDRYAEAPAPLSSLTNDYERAYYCGIAPRAKSESAASRGASTTHRHTYVRRGDEIFRRR